MEKSPLLSMHIEKTGGTSLLKLLETRHGLDHVFTYNAANRRFTRQSEKLINGTAGVTDAVKKIVGKYPTLMSAWAGMRMKLFKLTSQIDKQEISEVNFSDAEVIHGHFQADDFDPIFKDPQLIAVVREPLERMVSQYLHWRRVRAQNAWRFVHPFDSSVGFKEYAMLEGNQNFQSKAFGSKKIKDFKLVGVTEKLGEFAHELGLINGEEMPVLNQTPVSSKAEEFEISDHFREKFRDVNYRDYDLYEAARKRWDIMGPK